MLVKGPSSDELLCADVQLCAPELLCSVTWAERWGGHPRVVLGVTACGLVCRLREQQERAARLQKAVLAAEQQLHRETEKKQVRPLLWSVGRAARA